MNFAFLHSVIQPTYQIHQMMIKPSFPFLQTSFLASYFLLFDLHSQWLILFTCNTIKPYSFHLKSNTNKTRNKTMQKSWLCGITSFPVDTHCILIKCHTLCSSLKFTASMSYLQDTKTCISFWETNATETNQAIQTPGRVFLQFFSSCLVVHFHLHLLGVRGIKLIWWCSLTAVLSSRFTTDS